MAPSHPRLKARNTESKRVFSNNVPPALHSLPLDPKSQDFLARFRSLLMSKDERSAILALSEEDAKVFVEVIDRALRASQLDHELKGIAFRVLRKLCGRMGYLPSSYVVPYKSDLSERLVAFGGFSDVRKGTFGGKTVVIKSLRISESDDKIRIRKSFCKEVVGWKHLSHPNVLSLIGVPDTIEEGKISTVSEWMPNGNIVEYVRTNAGNRLKLLADAVEGLEYLHTSNIVHGDLKGANILVANTNPVSACLADFGFTTIVHDPGLGMESSKSEVDGGAAPFIAPEFLAPSMFGLERGIPTTEADIYAMAMTTYEVLAGTLPFGKQTGPEVVREVLGGARPPKPTNAIELGFSGNLWKLLEDCWQTEPRLRPPAKEALGRIKSAASDCGTTPPVGGVAQRHEIPDSSSPKFDQLSPGMTPKDIRDYPKRIYSSSALTNSLLALERPPSRESDASMPDSLFSKFGETSEATTHISDYGPHPRALADPISRPPTPGSEPLTRPRLFCDNSGAYRNKMATKSVGNDRTLLAGAAPRRWDQPRSDAVSYHNEPHTEKPPVADPVAPSYLAVPNATAIAMAKVRDNSTRQLTRPAKVLSFRGAMSRPVEPDASPALDDSANHKHRYSRFQFQQRFGKAFDQIVGTHRQLS